MILTPQQQSMLDGEQGETMAKVVKTLVMYGDAFGAERMVPVTGQYGHTVISFGLKAIQPVYDLYDQLISAGLTAEQRFTADPRPIDPAVPSSLLEDIVFKKIMYTHQKKYEEQLEKLGITKDEDYTCTCYLDQVGNKPEKGDVLSWAESSAVVYANSVLGARCNRNSGIIELMGSIAGFVPEFGLLTDEGRKASWIVDVRCSEKPEAQLLGSAIGMKVVDAVPYIRGMDKWLGNNLDDTACSYLKDFGAATASNGAVGLYHVEGLTPEAKESGESLIKDGAQIYIVDDQELARVKASYPVMWKDPDAKPALCFVGCPHLTVRQMEVWANAIEERLRQNGKQQVDIPTVFTASPAVIREAEKGTLAARLRSYGVIISYICPLMYMNNPLCKKKPVITCSNKLRTYTSARFYTEKETLEIITGGEGRQ